MASEDKYILVVWRKNPTESIKKKGLTATHRHNKTGIQGHNWAFSILLPPCFHVAGFCSQLHIALFPKKKWLL